MFFNISPTYGCKIVFQFHLDTSLSGKLKVEKVNMSRLLKTPAAKTKHVFLKISYLCYKRFQILVEIDGCGGDEGDEEVKGGYNAKSNSDYNL